MTGNNNNRPTIEPVPAEAQAADAKKLSMKGLKLELDDLTNFIEEEILGKLVALTNAVEAHNKAFKIVSDNQLQLQESDNLLASEILGLQTRTPTAEDEAARRGLRPAELKRTLTRTVPETLEVIPEEVPQPFQEAEQEPEEIRFGTNQHKVLEAIADSCIVMNDILLLCKAMKKVPELTDQTRIALLDLAGRRAGIEIQPGMQVRAGVKQIVA